MYIRDLFYTETLQHLFNQQISIRCHSSRTMALLASEVNKLALKDLDKTPRTPLSVVVREVHFPVSTLILLTDHCTQSLTYQL
jgi:hypothetical protein